MESLLISALTPLIGMILTSLVSWGISILKSKTKADIAKTSLDQVDQVVGTVVGGLAQTMAGPMKDAAADGKLSDQEKKVLKATAEANTKALLTDAVITAAQNSLADLDAYINQKIEEQVLAQKGHEPQV